jgi:TPR repeat protein
LIPIDQPIHHFAEFFDQIDLLPSATARACFLRAAKEGNGDAAVVAGEMLVNGRGGPADRSAAMRLFAGAAAQGHKGAQYALSVLEPAGSIPVSGGECITF